MTKSYYAPKGGLPAQGGRAQDRATFTTAYAVIPRGVLTDITHSLLPGWDKTHAWVLARPLSGFAETFAQLAVEIAPGGGTVAPEPDAAAQAGLFMLAGKLKFVVDGTAHNLAPGAYAYIPPGAQWSLLNENDTSASLMWIRKHYEPIAGHDAPAAFVTSDAETAPRVMPETDGKWATTRFNDPADIAHDMHINIVSLLPGANIPFAETHVMEHGLYVLQGKGIYLLNGDWVEVEAGDFMWLRAFCPQACYATGDEPFRYLLYKDVNRHAALKL